MSVDAQTARSQDQVALFNLLFGMSWEDPASDRRALGIVPGETLMTVTSGGCNTLTLLLEDPGRIYAVDINPTQSYLLELKCAAIRRLDCDSVRAFLGLAPSDDRLEVFERLCGDLSDAARGHWKAKPEAIRDGVVHAGKYESFVRLFARVLSVIQGRRRIEGLFRCETLAQQQAYFDTSWNTVQWRLLFKVLVSKQVLARRGLTADYFKFDDGSTSFSESFLRRARRAICEIPVQPNYFLARYLLGHYLSEDAVPAYLLRENLAVVKQRLDRIEIVTAPAQVWLGGQPDASIDAFSLSNICELMSLDETGRLFAEVARAARPGARICFRNLIVPRSVPESLSQEIVLDESLSRDLLANDRSFVYSRVQAFKVKKELQ
jgi:S-adenosylmethionine-diacylglycerol 3-amino-3-carboxypropyl transferase